MTDTVTQDRYRGWLMEFDHPPIPCRNFDWTATHPLYDPERPDAPLLLEATTRDELVAAIDAWADDAAVDAFADKMKAKMAVSRAKGREGWDDPARCSPDTLVRLMYAHAEKGDPVDVANFCMMIDHYGASTSVGERTVPGIAAAEPNALLRSIAELEAFERDGIAPCEVEDEVSFSESVLVCLHELMRLRQSVPELSAILRVVDSCGGTRASDESDDHHAGYNEALDAVEREMTRAWRHLTNATA